MATDFYTAVKTRRTVYALSNKSSVPDSRIEELLKEALTHVPSPFNSQSGRIVLLRGAKHDGFWTNLKEVLRGIVKDPAAFADTAAKVDGFKAGYGTVLFFEDQAVVKGLQDSFPLYKDNFPLWSLHSTGMMQYVVWTSLAVEGMGASLQHYSPLVDEWVYKNTGVPASWKLIAQMPFGVGTAPAGEKSVSPLSQRFKVVE
jgi:predicted oxidoreductase (fatty acid repression mutant protein)